MADVVDGSHKALHFTVSTGREGKWRRIYHVDDDDEMMLSTVNLLSVWLKLYSL